MFDREGIVFAVIIAGTLLIILETFGNKYSLIISGVVFIIVMFFFRDSGHFRTIGSFVPFDPNDALVVRALYEVIDIIESAGYNVTGLVSKESRKLSLFDEHVQYSPVKGVVIANEYIPGKFFNAFNDKLSPLNERNITVILSEDNDIYVIVRIAGMIARRIRTDVNVNDIVTPETKIGLIRFGSRVEYYHFKTN